jgi:hypothetical protein
MVDLCVGSWVLGQTRGFQCLLTPSSWLWLPNLYGWPSCWFMSFSSKYWFFMTLWVLGQNSCKHGKCVWGTTSDLYTKMAFAFASQRGCLRNQSALFSTLQLVWLISMLVSELYVKIVVYNVFWLPAPDYDFKTCIVDLWVGSCVLGQNRGLQCLWLPAPDYDFKTCMAELHAGSWV